MPTSIAALELGAARLGPMLDELTLVGGSAVGLLITYPAADPPRPTLDLDFVVRAATLAHYDAFGARLRAAGFTQWPAQPGDPLCRWRSGELVLDVMPLDESVLGFSNRWYRSALDHPYRDDCHPSLRYDSLGFRPARVSADLLHHLTSGNAKKMR